MTPLTFGMTSENAFATSASVRDRLISICIKLKELEGIMYHTPLDPNLLPNWLAMVAQQVSRCQQFSWRLLKDIEDSMKDSGSQAAQG